MTVANTTIAKKAAAIDIVTSRHEQMRGILAMLILDLDSEDAVAQLPRKTLASILWGVETLLVQAKEAMIKI